MKYSNAGELIASYNKQLNKIKNTLVAGLEKALETTTTPVLPYGPVQKQKAANFLIDEMVELGIDTETAENLIHNSTGYQQIMSELKKYETSKEEHLQIVAAKSGSVEQMLAMVKDHKNVIFGSADETGEEKSQIERVADVLINQYGMSESVIPSMKNFIVVAYEKFDGKPTTWDDIAEAFDLKESTAKTYVNKYNAALYLINMIDHFISTADTSDFSAYNMGPQRGKEVKKKLEKAYAQYSQSTSEDEEIKNIESAIDKLRQNLFTDLSELEGEDNAILSWVVLGGIGVNKNIETILEKASYLLNKLNPKITVAEKQPLKSSDNWTAVERYGEHYPSGAIPVLKGGPTGGSIDARNSKVDKYNNGLRDWLVRAVKTQISNLNFQQETTLADKLKEKIDQVAAYNDLTLYDDFHKFDEILRQHREEINTIFKNGGRLESLFADRLNESVIDLGLHILFELAKDWGLEAEEHEFNGKVYDVAITPPLFTTI